MHANLPLLVTAGEPAGIGPDLCLQLALERHPAPWLVAADPDELARRARTLGHAVRIVEREPGQVLAPAPVGTLYCLPIPLAAPVQPGVPDPANAGHVLAMLERAVNGCMRGEFAAVVTGPVHKGVINDAGYRFSGHTEFFADRTGQVQPVMLLVCPGLRVALATTHLPLRAVPDAITVEVLTRVLTVLDGDLTRWFGIARPRILVCGLNPHAGEGGHLGREELDVIAPALNELRRRGLDLSGPLPADTAFTPQRLEGADAVLAMYHDQGLPVLKHMGFGQAVNVTLGLPIIRTSVDHGTALDLAGRGGTDAGSLRAALHLAAELATRRRRAPS